MMRPPFYQGMIESLPLTIFLVYSSLISPAVGEEWLGPYAAGSLCSIVIVTLLIARKRQINRILLGIDVYLLSGTVGLVLNWVWLNQLYADLEEVAMLGWVVLIGIASALVKDNNFIGVQVLAAEKRAKWSLVLLMAAVLACVGAFVCRHLNGYFVFLPFVFLFSVQSVLRHKLNENQSQV